MDESRSSSEPKHEPAVAAPVTEPAPVQKKSRKAIIIGVVGLLLACCVITLGGMAFLGIGLFQTVAAVGVLAEADDDVERAMEAVWSALEGLADLDAAPSARIGIEISAAVASGTDGMAEAYEALDDAQAKIEALADDEIRSTYLELIERMRAAANVIEEVLVHLDEGATTIQHAMDGAESLDDGIRSLNESVRRLDANSYDAAEESAREATGKFEAARSAFREAHAGNPSAGFDRAVAYAEENVEETRIMVEMAGHKRAGRSSQFDAGLKRIDEIRSQSEGDPLFEILEDPDWFLERIWAAGDSYFEHIDEAIRLRDEVDTLIGL